LLVTHLSGDQKWWEKVQLSTPSDPWNGPPSVNVEISGYALLAFVAAGKTAEGLPIAKWIIAQQCPTGGFTSTQDTVNLYKFSASEFSVLKCLVVFRSLASVP